MALHSVLLNRRRFRYCANIHTGGILHCTFLFSQARRSHWACHDRRECWGDHLSTDASEGRQPLPAAQCQSQTLQAFTDLENLCQLFPLVGYSWACRILAFVFLFQLIIANFLIRTRLAPPAQGMGSNIWPDCRIFQNVTFCLTTAGTFFIEWALFVPLSYISSYALARGIDPTFSYQILAILNAGSFFGRWAPGVLADRLGRFNMMIATVFLCMVSVLGLWLTCAGSSDLVPQLIIFTLIFGFASGSNISLGTVFLIPLLLPQNRGLLEVIIWVPPHNLFLRKHGLVANSVISISAGLCRPTLRYEGIGQMVCWALYHRQLWLPDRDPHRWEYS